MPRLMNQRGDGPIDELVAETAKLLLDTIESPNGSYAPSGVRVGEILYGFIERLRRLGYGLSRQEEG